MSKRGRGQPQRRRQGGRPGPRQGGGPRGNQAPDAAQKHGRPRRDADDLGGDLVEGRHAVRELLLVGRRRVKELLVAEDIDESPLVVEILDLAQDERVVVKLDSPDHPLTRPFGGQGFDQFLRSLERRTRLTKKHRAVNLEVVVVAAVQRVEVERPGSLEVLVIGQDRAVVARHHVVVVAAQHVDVRRHVLQVAGVRHQVDQRVAGGERPLRVG